jgi:hypothetical protein
MAERQRYQTRLSPDRGDRVDDYAAENDLTQSEAVRRLIVAGLDATEQPTTEEIAADLRELRHEIETDDEPEGRDERKTELQQDPTTIYRSLVLALLFVLIAAETGLLAGL